MSKSTVLLPFTLALLATAACGGSTSNNNPNNNEGQDSGMMMAGDSGTGHDSGGTTGDSGVAGDTGTTMADSGTPAIDGGKFVAVPLDVCGPALQYAATATIGGTQQFQLVIDTGSSALGVAGSTCTSCGVTPEYTPDSTAIDEMQTDTADYGTGMWTGEVYQDNVAMGPSQAVPVKFGSMTSQSMFLGQAQCVAHNNGIQGIVGLAYPGAVSQAGTTPFFDIYYNTENVPDLFAMKLCDTTGTLWLGGFDGSQVTAAPKFTPLISPDMYQLYVVDFESLTIGSTTIQVGNGANSLVDTGTSIFTLNDTAYNALAAALNANTTFTQTLGANFLPPANTPTITCEAVQQTKAQLDAMLPPLTLTFGTGASAVTIQAAATDSYLYYSGQGQDWCVGIGGGGGSAGAIVGAPILKSNVLIFDRANSQLGFAPKTPCP